MKRLIAVCVVLLAAVAVGAPASALGASVSGIRAGVTCHDPCDDPFQLKAWVRGSNVGGLTVKFSVKGRTFSARTTSGGYAHYHLDINPTRYPQGVVVKVKASVTHRSVTRSDTTWFKPNYD